MQAANSSATRLSRTDSFLRQNILDGMDWEMDDVDDQDEFITMLPSK